MRAHFVSVLIFLPLAVGCVSLRVSDVNSSSYVLHVPASASDPAPLVVALHRLAETGASMMRRSRFNEVADREGFVVVYPRGKLRYWSAFEAQDRDDVAYVLEVIEDVARRVKIDRSRIYLTGASSGGFMTHRLACLRPDVFAAAAPVMALMPATVSRRFPNGAAIPMMFIHGSEDPIVGEDMKSIWSAGGFDLLPMDETIEYWVRRNHARAQAIVTRIPDRDPTDGTWTERREYAGTAPVVYLRVHGGGHTWPGGTEIAPRFIVGRQAHDFSASEAIWEFFRDRRLSTSPRHSARSTSP